MGHIKDLPKNNLGLKIEEDTVTPFFVFLPNKKKMIERLKKMLNNYNYVILATDPDREGEAISYHVYNELRGFGTSVSFRRAFINEVTYDGVLRGLANLGDINYSMVESQLTRRLIDRIIGYKISPVLWRNFKLKGLSAGRVQTSTLKIIFDRELEIEQFKPQRYYLIKLKFKIGDKILEAFIHRQNELYKLFDLNEVKKFELEFLKNLVNSRRNFKLINNERFIVPPDPLKTSTLQQEAAKMGIGNSEVMKIAQKLYEGVNVGDEKIGLITYHRTDSIRISDYGINLARKIIKDVVIHPRKNKAVFDAHEAIRITTTKPLSIIKNYLNNNEFRIYELIYRRFLASLSPACRYVHQQLYSQLSEELYISYQSGRIIDKGFIKILPDFVEKFKIFKNDFLEPKNQYLEIIDYEIEEEFTKPPARYTLSSIIKKMEEVGIGRPSTYASTIEILKKRKYIEVRKGSIYITDLGKRVVLFLFDKYSELLNVDFTSNLEELLDSIESSDYEMAKKMSFSKIKEIYGMLK